MVWACRRCSPPPTSGAARRRSCVHGQEGRRAGTSGAMRPGVQVLPTHCRRRRCCNGLHPSPGVRASSGRAVAHSQASHLRAGAKEAAGRAEPAGQRKQPLAAAHSVRSAPREAHTLPRQAHSNPSLKRTPNDTITPCAGSPGARTACQRAASQGGVATGRWAMGAVMHMQSHLPRPALGSPCTKTCPAQPRCLPGSALRDGVHTGGAGRWSGRQRDAHACPAGHPCSAASAGSVQAPGRAPAPRPAHRPTASERHVGCGGEPCCSGLQQERGVHVGVWPARKPSSGRWGRGRQTPLDRSPQGPSSTLAHRAQCRSPGPLRLQWRQADWEERWGRGEEAL